MKQIAVTEDKHLVKNEQCLLLFSSRQTGEPPPPKTELPNWEVSAALLRQRSPFDVSRFTEARLRVSVNIL